MDEAELIAAARSGDREAFDELVRRTFVDTYTLARRLTGDQEDAADVVQETYLRAWKGIGRFRGDAAMSTWLYRITTNAASNHTRKRRRQRAEPLDDVTEPADERLAVQPLPMALAGAEADRLGTALDALPPKLRVVVVAKDVYGLDHDSIAKELGISVSAAKVRLHRGRRKLRDLLDDEERAHAV